MALPNMNNKLTSLDCEYTNLKKQKIIDISNNNNKKKESSHRQWFLSDMFHKPEFFQIDKSPFALYSLFRSYEVRQNLSSEFMQRLKREFFDKGWIVSSLPIRRIREITKWSTRTIDTYIEKLVELRWIVIIKIDVGKEQKQNVYVLAKRNLISGKDEYLIDDFAL
jgi:hypothetical protein